MDDLIEQKRRPRQQFEAVEQKNRLRALKKTFQDTNFLDEKVAARVIDWFMCGINPIDKYGVVSADKINLIKAVKWYRKAAEQGLARAQNNLGVCYGNGQGVSQSYTEAVKWYRKAVAHGHAYAQFKWVVSAHSVQGAAYSEFVAVQCLRRTCHDVLLRFASHSSSCV